MTNEIIAAADAVTSVQTHHTNSKDLTKAAQSVKTGVPPYWDATYINEHLRAMPAGSHKMLFQFLWMTGCRITEALSVRKRDIDLKNYTVRVRWLKSRKYQERTVPLHPRLHDMLEVYAASMSLDDRLFPISRQRAHQLTQRHFNGHPHMFRHSFAVNWLRQDGRLEILSRALGHSDIRITMTYLAIVPQDVGKELLKVRFE